MDTLGRQSHIDAVSLARAGKFELVTTHYGNLELGASELSNDQRFEIDGYGLRASWHNDTLVLVKSNSLVFTIIIDLFDGVLSLDLRIVS